jgi:hypothetical protein
LSITSRLRLLHGTDEPLQEPVALRAGPLTAVLDGVDLRYVRLGDTELVRRIYVAVRDRNWNTIPGVTSEVEIGQADDSFAVRFEVRHYSPDTDFSWRGTITGSGDGRISFQMDGRGERSMLYNRIGFCVLHPWREAAGRRFRGQTPDGPVAGELPLLVGPQRFVDGAYVALLPSVSRLEVELPAGGNVLLEFEGDLFETEDQRNWTDASFKTYCTPLALGFPHELGEGERKTQTVSVSAVGTTEPLPLESGSSPLLSVGGSRGARVPDIGLAVSAGVPGLSGEELRLLRVLGPAHLRCEVHLGQTEWPAGLAAAVGCARSLAARLELALFVDGAAVLTGLDALASALAGVDLARVLVAVQDAQTTTVEETTPPDVVSAVREGLALGSVPVAGGTDMYFCELNRTRPATERMDGVFWSMNGQVHAFDDISVLETPEAQGEQVRAARAFAAGRPLFVGPVTLRRRYNVNATGPEEQHLDELPDSVDPRQASLIGAAWTLASVKHLSEQGADAVTYFETMGWRGVIQGDDEPALPEQFPGRAGQVFPLFHVLADAAELRGAEVARCEGGDPLEVAAVAAIRPDGALSVLAANLTGHPLSFSLTGVAGEARVRRCNENTAELAMSEPERFRASASSEPVSELRLAPYETVRIDTYR